MGTDSEADRVKESGRKPLLSSLFLSGKIKRSCLKPESQEGTMEEYYLEKWTQIPKLVKEV